MTYKIARLFVAAFAFHEFLRQFGVADKLRAIDHAVWTVRQLEANLGEPQ